MAKRNTIRPVTFGLAAWMLVSVSVAQKTPAANTVANGSVTPETIVSASPQIALMPPPKAPKVTCDGNQLTITADNSTLAGILSAVHSCIGVQVDIPEGAAGKRIFETLGPGPAREVLESLLSGTDFNFAIGSPASDPQKVDSVLLLLKTTDSSASAATDRTLTPARRAWLQSRQNAKLAGTLGEDINHQTAVESTDYPAVEEAAPIPADAGKPAASQSPASDTTPAASDTPAVPTDSATVLAPTPAMTSDAASTSNPALSQDKSTAERIADMQQLFQQRRQLNQNQNQTQGLTSPQP